MSIDYFKMSLNDAHIKITKHTQEEMLFTATYGSFQHIKSIQYQWTVTLVLGHAYMLEPQLSLDLNITYRIVWL